MTNKIKLILTIVLTSITVDCVTGQDTNFASNVNRYLSLDGKQLVIKYDLPSSDTTQLFDIILRIYYNDKVIQPQDSSLTGSWGNMVSPGIEKVILWDFPNEFKGEINKVTIDVVARKIDGPMANFSFKITNNRPPFEVKFENLSKNADYYSWKFGDLKSRKNNLSTLDNPVHKFKTGGSYNVELIAGSSKTKTTNNIMRVVTLAKSPGQSQDVQKYKKMRTIWLGSAVVTAGAGGYALLKSNSLYKEYKTSTPDMTDKLEKQYKTYGIIGPAALVVSGACIAEVIIQSKKIRAAELALNMNFIPLDKGAVVGIACNF